MPNNARGSYLLTSCHIGAANDETNAKRPKSEELLLLAGAKFLSAEDTTLYRSVTMCVNYLSPDSSDLSFAAGSLARGMKSPTTKDFGELKRVGCYLQGRPVGAIVFEPQTLPGVFKSG